MNNRPQIQVSTSEVIGSDEVIARSYLKTNKIVLLDNTMLVEHGLRAMKEAKDLSALGRALLTVEVTGPIFLRDSIRKQRCITVAHGDDWGLFPITAKNAAKAFYVPPTNRPIFKNDSFNDNYEKYSQVNSEYISALVEFTYAYNRMVEQDVEEQVCDMIIPPCRMSNFVMTGTILEWFGFVWENTQPYLFDYDEDDAPGDIRPYGNEDLPKNILWEQQEVAKQVAELLEVLFPQTWTWLWYQVSLNDIDISLSERDKYVWEN